MAGTNYRPTKEWLLNTEIIHEGSGWALCQTAIKNGASSQYVDRKLLYKYIAEMGLEVGENGKIVEKN